MGFLDSAEPTVVICTKDRTRPTAFYRDCLGLTLAEDNELAAIFSVGRITLRVSFVADFAPHEHAILGFRVRDVRGTVKVLTENGVVFNRYPKFAQDEFGILALPGGTKRVAWFNDPDGNVLSITDV